MDGWGRFGAAVFGGGNAAGTVQREQALAKARQARDEAAARSALAAMAGQRGDHELAAAFFAGMDPRHISGYRKDQQAIGWGDEAMALVDDPANIELINRMNLVRSGKPADLTKIQDHTAFNPMALPGSQELATNEIGQALIGREQARAGAYGAQANASNALASQRYAAVHGGGGSGSGTPGKASDYQIIYDAEGRAVRVHKGTGEASPVMVGDTPLVKAGGVGKGSDKEATKAASQLTNSVAQMDRMAGIAQDLLQSKGLGRITGIPGVFPNVPGMAGADADAKLETLKSQVGFAVLQQMRDMSKTGGALGAVSDKENQLLQNNLAALQTSQSEAQLRESLQRIVDYANESKQRLREAYEDTYGEGGNELGAAMGLPAAPDPSAADDVEDIREVGGQTYVKIAGQWYAE